ncbi:MAG: tetratricopeptide repeat protein [Ignavibacteriales bacterium]|nr:tetratricopeptide repeat protein [Ignavibacteriales bacterium]
MYIRKTCAHGLAIALALSLAFSTLGASADEAKKKLIERRHFEGESISAEKKTADAHYRLGVENLREESTNDFAVEQLGKAIELDETNAEYHYQLAEAYLAKFEYANLLQKPFIAPKVKTQLELAVRCDPSSTLYREALIQYYVFAPGILGGSYEKAHEQADEIAQRDPYLGVLAHAGILSEEGEGERSLALYKKAMRAQPKSWEAYHRLGLHYLNAQETDEAITMFRKCVDLAPEQADSYNCLGQAYQQKGMYAEAISAFQKALERDPSLAHLVFRIAQLCELKGMKNPALENYQRYLSMIPRGHAADDAREKIRLLMK